jgi:2-iminobutanoate/2-iminopropanoate deaminase
MHAATRRARLMLRMHAVAPPFPWAEGVDYSQAVVAGPLVFVAGQGPFEEDGRIVATDFAEQLRRTYRNLERVLAEADASLGDVAQMTVYLVEESHYAIFKTVRREFFEAPFPASTVVRAGLLFEGMLVEIDAIAVRGGRFAL